MTKIKYTLSALALALGLFTAKAQITTNSPEGSFPSAVLSYFTAFNTNLDSTFALEKGTVWTGVDSIQGGSVPLANCLGISYDLWKMVSVESVTRNSGVAGTVLSEQFGAGLNFVVHDAKLTLYADGGYNLYSPGKSKFADRLYVEMGLRAMKALTTHTFAFIGLGVQLPSNLQILSAGGGFTF